MIGGVRPILVCLSAGGRRRLHLFNLSCASKNSTLKKLSLGPSLDPKIEKKTKYEYNSSYRSR